MPDANRVPPRAVLESCSQSRRRKVGGHVRALKLVGLAGLVTGLILLIAQPLGASGAAPVRFGAKLTKSSQPSNAEGGRSCDENGDGQIPLGGVCTWVSVEAYHNGGHEKAPKAGTIGKLRLVSCVAGSFRLQLARAKPALDQARVVRNGPMINYQADPRQVDGDDDTFCGGEEGNDYIIQTFSINVHVNKGDFIAIRTADTGALYCAGGSGVLLFNPPLGRGGAFRTATEDTSCNLLVQLEYKPGG